MKRHIRLNTPFETTDIPLSEYPRPQFQRDSYVTLNGKWQYAIYRNSERFDGYQGDILVPYSPESLLSCSISSEPSAELRIIKLFISIVSGSYAIL